MLTTFVVGAGLTLQAAFGQTAVAPPLADEVPVSKPVSSTLEAVTFAQYRGMVFVPVREIGPALKVYVGWNNETRRVELDEVPIPTKAMAKLADGTNLVEIGALKGMGYEVSAVDGGFDVRSAKATARVTVPEKWVEISLEDQELTAWQGSRLVLRTNVSTGRAGYRTPTGEFTAGPEKARMRYSRTYDNSPMPYAIQLWKGYFVHGYPSVPSYPASHGCIRMPLTGANPAKVLFEWIDLGVKVSIRKDWSDRVAGLLDEGLDAED